MVMLFISRLFTPLILASTILASHISYDASAMDSQRWRQRQDNQLLSPTTIINKILGHIHNANYKEAYDYLEYFLNERRVPEDGTNWNEVLNDLLYLSNYHDEHSEGIYGRLWDYLTRRARILQLNPQVVQRREEEERKQREQTPEVTREQLAKRQERQNRFQQSDTGGAKRKKTEAEGGDKKRQKTVTLTQPPLPGTSSQQPEWISAIEPVINELEQVSNNHTLEELDKAVKTLGELENVPEEKKEELTEIYANITESLKPIKREIRFSNTPPASEDILQLKMNLKKELEELIRKPTPTAEGRTENIPAQNIRIAQHQQLYHLPASLNFTYNDQVAADDQGGYYDSDHMLQWHAKQAIKLAVPYINYQTFPGRNLVTIMVSILYKEGNQLKIRNIPLENIIFISGFQVDDIPLSPNIPKGGKVFNEEGQLLQIEYQHQEPYNFVAFGSFKKGHNIHLFPENTLQRAKDLGVVNPDIDAYTFQKEMHAECTALIDVHDNFDRIIQPHLNDLSHKGNIVIEEVIFNLASYRDMCPKCRTLTTLDHGIGKFFNNHLLRLFRERFSQQPHIQIRGQSPLNIIVLTSAIASANSGVGKWLERAKTVIPQPISISPSTQCELFIGLSPYAYPKNIEIENPHTRQMEKTRDYKLLPQESYFGRK